MAGFNLNDTVGLAIRILQNHRELIRLWHELSALLTKIGLLPQGVSPQRASHSYDVEWVQSSLNTLDNAGLQVDGVYGPATFEAVKKYQARNHLEPDGWAGMLTMVQLEQDMAGSNRARR